MVHRLTPGYAPPGSVSHIPLNPRADNWEHRIPFWSKSAWNALKYSGAKKAQHADSSISSAFLEDEFGHTVPEEVRKSVYKDVRGFFLDKSKNPETRDELGPQDQIGLRLSEEFRIQLEGKYPWLRLCDGHWKVAQLWTNVWTSWASNHPSSTPASDNEKKPTTGIKRGNTDDDDLPDTPSKKVKKDKGKNVDRLQVQTTKSRPKSTKIIAKLPTVSISFPRYRCLHTHRRA